MDLLHIPSKISAMFDRRRLTFSGSSLFTLFIFTAISFILFFTILTVFTLSIQSKDFSEVKIEIKTVIPYNLPLTSQKVITFPSQNTQLQVIEIFRRNETSEKFDRRVKEFMNNGCDVNFIMTWISPSELFGKREILAIESIFKVHPNGCLMILSSSMDSPKGYKIIKPFIQKGYKILALTPNLPFLLKNTSGESWLQQIETGKLDPGKISLGQNLSNLLRLAALYKYGGIYIDTDMIILKSFKGLKNVIGAQTLEPFSRNWTRLNNAVLIFDKNHPLLFKFIEEFALTFNGNIWGHNGPYLVSRVARAAEGMKGYNDFTILPPSAFYPVNWIEIEKLFKSAKNERDSKWVEAKLIQMKKNSYGLHLWNKFSKKFEMEEESAIRRLVLEHCIICKDVQR